MIKLETTTAYDVKEAAELLHVSEHTVRKYVHNGRLRGQKVGRSIYVTEETLKEFLNNEVKSIDN